MAPLKDTEDKKHCPVCKRLFSPEETLQDRDSHLSGCSRTDLLPTLDAATDQLVIFRFDGSGDPKFCPKCKLILSYLSVEAMPGHIAECAGPRSGLEELKAIRAKTEPEMIARAKAAKAEREMIAHADALRIKEEEEKAFAMRRLFPIPSCGGTASTTDPEDSKMKKAREASEARARKGKEAADVKAKVISDYLAANEAYLAEREAYLAAKEAYLVAKEAYLAALEAYLAQEAGEAKAREAAVVKAKVISDYLAAKEAYLAQEARKAKAREAADVKAKVTSDYLAAKEAYLAAKEAYLAAKEANLAALEAYLAQEGYWI